jgi:hypothetical protein
VLGVEGERGDVAPEDAHGLSWTPSKADGDGDKEKSVHRRSDHRRAERAPAGNPTAELCRKHGVSGATFCDWGSRYGGMEVSEALAEGPRGREPQAEEAAGGIHAERRDAEGSARGLVPELSQR